MDNEKSSKLVTDHDVVSKENNDPEDGIESDEEYEETVTFEKEHISSEHSSLITDKYKENMDAPTVANKLADMIIDLECNLKPSSTEKYGNPDPDEIYYSDDEIYQSDDEDDEEENDPEHSDFSFEEKSQWKRIKKIRQDSEIFLTDSRSGWINYCRCGLGKQICFALEHIFELDRLNLDNETLNTLRSEVTSELRESVVQGRQDLARMEICMHNENDLNTIFEKVIKGNKENADKTHEYVKKQTKKIKENAKKICVAPGEGGEWKNWQADLFLEEKLFPALFPYGIGGYLSSNMLKRNNMGFSNYVKNRLLSADDKFRNDPSYLFFLLLVKEMVDMKRSKQTYFRKATKIPKLSAKNVQDISKEYLYRYDNAYTTFKTIRGTAMYYQDTKKKLMATLRQKGAPTLFTTLSCAEFEWHELIQKTYETVTKTKVDKKFIEDQDPAWKNKLISENVVQSTLHFAKRTDKIMSLLTKDGMFTHQNVMYKAESYFYRVEFQARGAPHIHCLLWLKGENGEIPPSMWEDEQNDENIENVADRLSNFGGSIISGSSKDMHCDAHSHMNENCNDCENGKALVEKFQSHRHTFTCKKKGKVIRILPGEGHGRLDGKVEEEVLLVPVCRFNHPRNPIDRTEFLLGFPEDVDEEDHKKAKADYSKIRKFLLRITHGDDFEKKDKWRKFKQMTFFEFLFEVGMFEKSQDFDDENARTLARRRYVTALRCEVKSSGLLLLRRDPEDVLTNNYNKKLIKIHQANQDIQYITDEYAVAEYICNYLTKSESGTSALLKNINDEAIDSGEAVTDTIDKLAKALDKGREVGIQEAVYRLLGLTMTKFSAVVRFINTNHPDRREGLLKSDLNNLDDEEEGIFHNSIHDYYQDRPVNSKEDETEWDEMSLSKFVASYNIAYKSSTSQGKKQSQIKLQNGRGFIVKRKNDCVIRYFLKYDNEEEYFRALCILFLPFRNERSEIHNKNVQMLYNENVDQIEEGRREFEKYRGMVDILKEVEKNKETSDDIEEDEDNENEYIEDETSNQDEIADFEKHVKEQAKKSISRYNEGLESMSDDNFLELVNTLNGQQRKILDDFVERINSGTDDDPLYLYIGGEAGTGKSYVLRLMIDAVKQLGKRSGRELEKPVSITIAPTGVAAYLVNGTTIESALGMQPQKGRSYISNKSSRNSQLRFLYEDLKVIFLDEVSMCGSDMLTRINFRLQEIMGNTKFMGGVSMVTTGDFGQLPPVGQSMIWDISRLDNRIDICPNHWDENFVIYYLDTKMRSQDNEFSTICDLVRKGVCDEQVQKYMESHIRTCPNENDNQKYAEGKLSIIVTTNDAREKINLEKLEKLLPTKKTFFASAKDQATNLANAPPLSEKLALTATGQLQTTIVFKEGAPVMITSNHPKQKYKNNGIVNGARGYIDSIQPSKKNPDVAEVIWVRFTDDKIGQLLRKDSMSLLKHHKPNDPLAVPITKQKKQFSVKGNVNWMREQFPVTLAYAITSHKSQGQTLEEVIIDFSAKSTRINNGSFYTAVSRVKFGDNLFLKDFKTSYIKANPNVEKKMMSMKLSAPYIFKKIYNEDKIFKEEDKELKLGYININGLYQKNSHIFINNDQNLLDLDFLAVADTRLSNENKSSDLENSLSNWKLLNRFDSNDGVKHMGLLLLQSRRSKEENIVRNIAEKIYFKYVGERKVTYMQILKVSFLKYHLTSAFVYIRQTPTETETVKLEQFCNTVDLIMGDLNMDTNRPEDANKIRVLCQKRSKVLNEITTIRFNQLDHILLDCNLFQISFTTCFRNHTTDHYTIVIRIPVISNAMSDSFLQRINFDGERWTRTFKRKRFNISQSERNTKQLITESEKQEIDFKCLFSPNWLTAVIIDSYMKLLQTIDLGILIFETSFSQTFQEVGYENLAVIYKDKKIINCKKIYIPIYEENHCYLVTCDKSELSLFDPYNFPDTIDEKKKELLLENYQNHLKFLMRMKDLYFKPLYENHNLTCPDFELSIFLPPKLPSLKNSYDCGVFLAMFVKYLIQKKKFDFDGDTAICIRESMREELALQKIMVTQYKRKQSKVDPKKRKLSTQTSENPSMKKPKTLHAKEGLHRTFKNPDSESCWINSCLQLVLTAMEHKAICAETGSPLWEHLIWLMRKGKSTSLNPIPIRDLIITKEKQRIIEGNIAPINRLFDLGHQEVFDDRNLLMNPSTSQRIGQQDSKDFFICLAENRNHWLDVYNLFTANSVSFTTCSSCQNVSRQEKDESENIFFTFECPKDNLTMSALIERKMNGSEIVNDWRDEDGCNKITIGKNSTRIQDVGKTEFLIFVLSRLMEIDGNLNIIDTKVPVGGSVSLKDSNGHSAEFSPMAVIHHSGIVMENTTMGHYQADLMDKHSRKWIRTSDDELPTEISVADVTDQGYIFLYKKNNISRN
eukprot:GFUD01024642.1.p1 GENE.GFUD01024642.1~~GFUD01024642.1.p1  ORF type:complete len:2733 (+),score=580.47 GFUD01024642.1:994-8199(+)